MPAAATIVAALATVLEGVTGIGRVNQFDRFFADEQAFRGYHAATENGVLVINSATITLSAVRPGATRSCRGGGALASSRDRVFEIKLMRGQHDSSASQLLLADLCDAVFDAFEADAARDALLALGFVYEPIEIAPIGMASYGNPPFVLVNQAVATLTLNEVLS